MPIYAFLFYLRYICVFLHTTLLSIYFYMYIYIYLYTYIFFNRLTVSLLISPCFLQEVIAIVIQYRRHLPFNGIPLIIGYYTTYLSFTVCYLVRLVYSREAERKRPLPPSSVVILSVVHNTTQSIIGQSHILFQCTCI